MKTLLIFLINSSLLFAQVANDNFKAQFNKASKTYQDAYMNANCEVLIPYLDENLIIFENGEHWPYTKVKEFCPHLPVKPVISTERSYKILSDDMVYEFVSQIYRSKTGNTVNESQAMIWKFNDGNWNIINYDVSRNFIEQEIETESQTTERDKLKEEIWRVVETKFYSWRDNDLDSHLKTYHPNWQRWSLNSDKMLQKDDVKMFWVEAKKREKIIDMQLNLVDFDFWENSVAVVHFTSKEKFEWIGPRSPNGKEAGDVYEGILRWSDIYVKENDKWLCVGGHRDLSQLKDGLKKLN